MGWAINGKMDSKDRIAYLNPIPMTVREQIDLRIQIGIISVVHVRQQLQSTRLGGDPYVATEITSNGNGVLPWWIYCRWRLSGPE